MKLFKILRSINATAVGSLILAAVLVAGTVWMGNSTQTDTLESVRAVSLLYLDELAGRREQVVENNLAGRIQTIRVAMDLMTKEDLSDKAHLEAYQKHMKQLYNLDRFAFVDTDGLIYTSVGTERNIEAYHFDYKTLSQPDISLFREKNGEEKVIIAVPAQISFQEKTLSVCFMSMNMEEMLAGVSMTTNTGGATFCNLYTSDGTALTNSVLGGLAEENNLLTAMRNADFENPYSYENLSTEFQEKKRGVVSIVYNGIQETLTYIPVVGTDWQLTYLIRESVISDRISHISERSIQRSLIQVILTVMIMALMFYASFRQIRKTNALMVERETAETENRVKQEELEHRLELQNKLLEETRHREQQDEMITALSSDYWSVYYIELDRDEGICYRSHADLEDPGFQVGDRFPYRESVEAYARRYVADENRDAFLEFVKPESIRRSLQNQQVVSYTYKVHRHGGGLYETVRFACVRRADEKDGQEVNRVGACFVNVDSEIREVMAQRQALSDALSSAEEANKAKTAFLSNMSHEIRTPMNAIIGLNNIALHDPEISEKTRNYLEKIGSSAQHLLQLINDILDMSRIESGRMTLKKEEFSFRKMLEAINTMFSSQCLEKGLDYQCRLTSEVDDYYIGDDMKLRQVLINILGNAVKFTPRGGKVELEVNRKVKYGGKTALCFTISDTGIGMNKEFIPHIFDTFTQEDSSTTSKYGSSGLGLAITKNIVETMNGDIQVESEKGKGSRFAVTVTLDDSARTEADGVLHEIHPESLTVLVVDDDPIAREHAVLVMEKAGIFTETAASGAEAMEMVQLRQARMKPYNLILMDWQMPEMDGIEATRQIRTAVGNESAIIILTAYKWDDVLPEALQAGVDSFLPKPIFAATVLEEYKSALSKKKKEDHKADAEDRLKGKHILLAEDMEVNAEIIIMVLQMRGMETEHAENGKVAVEMFSSHPAGYYDAILMDMRMPEMDGLEATRMIRSMDREDAGRIPIIALTANAFDEDVQRSLQAGLNAHLSKPVQPESLFATLENLIRS